MLRGSLQEQKLFDKILWLSIRLKKDGKEGTIKFYKHKNQFNLQKVKSCKIKSSTFSKNINLATQGFILKKLSYGSCLYYLRKKLNFDVIKMAEIFNLTESSYKQLEANTSIFKYFRKMQYVCFVERNKIQDEILGKILMVMKSELYCEDELNYYLVKLSALFSLNNSNSRKLTFQFFKDYRIERSDNPNKIFYIGQKIKLFKNIVKIEETEKLFADELEIIDKLKEILKKDILADYSDKEIINKTNVSLGLKCVDISSVYTLSFEEARNLFVYYEMYKKNNILNVKQLNYINRCCELLTYVLNPGQNLMFEITRIKENLNLSWKNFEKVIGLAPRSLNYIIMDEEKIKRLISESREKFEQLGYSFEEWRYRECFAENFVSPKM